MREWMAMYVGPDQVMPVMSILATIVGFLLIFWNKLLGIFRRIFGSTKRESAENPPAGSNATHPNKPPTSY